MDAEAEGKKRRSANFSGNDYILLASIIGQPSKMQEKLTSYQLHKHKFTGCITSSTKKLNWGYIVEKFNSQAEVPRRCEDIIKKWDNLVQTHRNKYQDFQREQSATGGGPSPGVLSAITKAVMDVIGRRGANLTGVACSSSNDSSQVMLQRLAKTSTNHTVNEVTEENEITTAFVFTEPNDLEDLMPLQTVTKRSLSISPTSQKCQCEECINIRQLKKRKLELQIKYFSKIEQ